MMKRFLWACVALTLAILAFCLVLVGVLAIFGSFFFEETHRQLTLQIVLQHVGVFFGGVVAVVSALFALPLIGKCADKAL